MWEFPKVVDLLLMGTAENVATRPCKRAMSAMLRRSFCSASESGIELATNPSGTKQKDVIGPALQRGQAIQAAALSPEHAGS